MNDGGTADIGSRCLEDRHIERLRAADHDVERLRAALLLIVRLDYRGNRSPEQEVAADALGLVER